MSSHAGPICGIWRKWSITHSVSKPASSAASAMSRSRSPSSAGPPGQVKRGICNPKRRPIGRAAGDERRSAGRRQRRRHERDAPPRPGRGGRRSPGRRSAAWRTLGHSASWRRSTASGTRVGARPVAPPALGRRRVEDDGDARHAGVAAGQPPAPRAGRCRACRRPSVSRRRRRRRDDRRRARRTRRRDAREVVRALADERAQRVARHDDAGRECVAAHVDLPEPAGPTSTTRHGDGSSTGPG